MRPCLEPGCPALSPNTRCPQHTRAKQRRRDAIRGTPEQRGYDGLYRKNRQLVLSQSRTCVYCGARATTVDHRVALRQGGTNDPSNLVPACIPCNSSRGAKLGNAIRWR